MAKPGRPAQLTRDRIVAAVVTLLERDGVDAISTRTVGEALGVHPTALYRHFRDMDELVREAADHVLAGLLDDADADPAPDPDADPEPDADAALAEVVTLCRRLRVALMARPGAARVMAPGPSRKPNERALTERMLALLVRSGLPHEQAALAYHALVEFVVGSAAIDSAVRGGGAQPQDEDDVHQQWRADYQGASPEEFPHTTALAAWLYPSQETQFQFGLDLIVEGLRRRRTP
jgi:TetR/AcrR family transcriptional regulator, tetracycline repressor protein